MRQNKEVPAPAVPHKGDAPEVTASDSVINESSRPLCRYTVASATCWGGGQLEEAILRIAASTTDSWSSAGCTTLVCESEESWHGEPARRDLQGLRRRVLGRMSHRGRRSSAGRLISEGEGK
jgi:hypothetical protein